MNQIIQTSFVSFNEKKEVFLLQKWSLREVVLLAFLAFLFGGVFMGAGFLNATLNVLLTPLGLGLVGKQVIFGMWTMAAPMAAMLIPKKGSAILGEVLAALAEMIYGSYFGPGVLLSGFIQGLGTELGFVVTGYKRYDYLPLVYGAIGTIVFSFVHTFIKYGFHVYPWWMILTLFLVRLLSVMFFGVVVVSFVMKLYNKSQQLATL